MVDLSIPRDENMWLYRKEDVFAVLKQLYNDNTLITIFYKNIFCLSTVVDYDHDYLWLDAASTQEGFFLAKQPEIYLLSHTTSVPLFMELRHCEVISMDNKPTWQFDLPTRVHKRQRRDAYRAYFPKTIQNNVKLNNYEKNIYLLDLSLTGLGLISEDSITLELEKIYPLQLEIAPFQKNPGSKMEFTVIVKYIGDTFNGKKKIGVQFVNNTRNHENFLSKWQHLLQFLNKN